MRDYFLGPCSVAHCPEGSGPAFAPSGITVLQRPAREATSYLGSMGGADEVPAYMQSHGVDGQLGWNTDGCGEERSVCDPQASNVVMATAAVHGRNLWVVSHGYTRHGMNGREIERRWADVHLLDPVEFFRRRDPNHWF